MSLVTSLWGGTLITSRPSVGECLCRVGERAAGDTAEGETGDGRAGECIAQQEDLA